MRSAFRPFGIPTASHIVAVKLPWEGTALDTVELVPHDNDHVVSADTINTFKNRLDKFWSDLHGIGNCSLL